MKNDESILESSMITLIILVAVFGVLMLMSHYSTVKLDLRMGAMLLSFVWVSTVFQAWRDKKRKKAQLPESP